MNKNQVFGFFKSEKAFTLIELLVVIAIIGILSSVVVVSINSAREKGKIASIKSTLKQLYNQAAINQVTVGSFTGSNSSYTDLTCTGPDNNLGEIIRPLEDQGVVVKCFSFYGDGLGGTYAGDNYNRFGATALVYDAGEVKAWSVDENGVVVWDKKGVNSSGVTLTGADVSMDWTTANSACATNGGRLPSIEQARNLSHAWYSKVSAWNPLGFYATNYWASSSVPSSASSLAYYENMYNGNLYYNFKISSAFVRCVR